MKKEIIIAIMLIASWAAFSVAADEDRTDLSKTFYRANAYYEDQDYAKAAEEYLKILDSGLESGNLYYNIGNSFFKLGRIGYAVLCYEKARRLIPGDSDLKSNLDYARAFVEDSASSAMKSNFFARTATRTFSGFSLSQVAALGLVIYMIAFLFSAANLVFPHFSRKARLIYIFVIASFILSLAAFTIRYRNEEILKHGVVLLEEAECRYEPIEKSTVYYKVREGQDVLIVCAKNGWRQIKRPDGRIAWVKSEVVGDI